MNNQIQSELRPKQEMFNPILKTKVPFLCVTQTADYHRRDAKSVAQSTRVKGNRYFKKQNVMRECKL